MSNGTINDCSGFFYDPGGSNADYSINTSLIQTICSDNGQGLMVTFSQFSTESTFDVLKIYDGSSISDPLIGTFSGSIPIDTIFSSGTCLTFEFTSDNSINYPGWVAEFQCFGIIMGNGTNNLCSGNFYDSGGLNNNYGFNLNQTKTICSGNNNPLLVNFMNFNLENGFDFLYVYDGPNVSSPLIGTYTGSASPGFIISSNTCLTFNFTSDAIINAPGWVAEINCGYIMNNNNVITCEGNFYDEGGPNGNYLPSSNFTKTFTSANGQALIMNFSQFDLENNYDFLYLYDGSSISSPLIGTYTGTNSPGLIISSGNSITARYTSDITIEKSGWKAEINCNTPDLELVKVESSKSFCGLSNEPVNFFIRNNSFSPISNIPVSFSVNGGNWISELFSGTISPGDTAIYTFLTAADLSQLGTNVINGAVNFVSDANSSNDSSQYSINTYSAFDASTGPYSMGFELTESANLQYWNFIDKNQDAVTWEVVNSSNYAGNACLRKASSVNNDDDWAVTGCIQLTGGVTYHLEYYFKNFELLSPCFLEVYCGNDPTLFSGNQLIYQNPIPGDTSYQYTSVFFTPATSGVYYLAFHAYEGSSTSSLRLDNINLSVSPSAVSENQASNGIRVFPNPAKGIFSVYSDLGSADLSVKNTLGEDVFHSNIYNGKNEFDLSNLGEGTFFIVVRNKEKTITKKVILLKN